MRRMVLLAMAVAGAAGLAGVARANPVKSLYTTVELKDCKQFKRAGNLTAWLCEGLPGFPVYIAEGDQHHFVSIGPNAERRRAAKQSLRPINSIFEPGSDRSTIEWRFDRKGEHEIPYAVIIRFHTKSEQAHGDVLVVFKVMDYDTCQIAHIDALANDEPVVLARRIADQEARNFDCSRAPRQEGAAGKSPM